MLPSQVPPLTWRSYLRGLGSGDIVSLHWLRPSGSWTGTHTPVICVPAPMSRMLRPQGTVGDSQWLWEHSASSSATRLRPREAPSALKGQETGARHPTNEAPQNQTCPICNLFFTHISPPVNLDFKLDCKHLERSRDQTSTHTATMMRYFIWWWELSKPPTE